MSGQRRYQEQDSPPGRKHIADILGKPFYHCTPGFPAVKGILEPVVHPLFRLCRQIGGIEEDKVEGAPETGKKVSPDHSVPA